MPTINLIVSTYVLNALWQIPVIVATAWVCMKFANRLPAKYRHAVWVATLLLGVLLPLMSLSRPKIAASADTAGSVHMAKKDGSNPLLEKNATGLLSSGVHPFSVAEVRAGMERATQLFVDHGYPEAQLQPETDIDEVAHQINLIVRVTEGTHKQ